MLIAVSGSQGAGKSTLLSHMQDSAYSVIQRKTARSVLEENNWTLDEIYKDLDLHMHFQDLLYQRKKFDESPFVTSKDIWLTERSYTDLFVYAVQNLGKHNHCNAWLEQYYEKCVAGNIGYEAIIYLKGAQFEVKADGVRSTNRFFSRMIDLSMIDFNESMMTLYSRFFPISGDILEERVNTALHIIDQIQE